MPWKLLADRDRYINGWLLGYSGGLGSIAGVLICDYWFIRKEQPRPRRSLPARRRLRVRLARDELGGHRRDRRRVLRRLDRALRARAARALRRRVVLRDADLGAGLRRVDARPARGVSAPRKSTPDGISVWVPRATQGSDPPTPGGALAGLVRRRQGGLHLVDGQAQLACSLERGLEHRPQCARRHVARLGRRAQDGVDQVPSAVTGGRGGGRAASGGGAGSTRPSSSSVSFAWAASLPGPAPGLPGRATRRDAAEF